MGIPLCIAEVMCMVIGIVILVTVLTSGGFPVGTTKELRGAPAYISSGLLMAVFPVLVLVGCGMAGFAIHQKQEIDDDDWKLSLIELGVMLIFVVPALCVAIFGAQPRKRRKKKKKRRREYEDYEDYDDRPRRRRDDDQEDRPRRRPRDPNDFDDRPRRRRDDLDDRAR